jgi:hypothetical protein
MHLTLHFAAWITALTAASPPALGLTDTKSYSTSYVSFQIPATWDCQLEQTVYVCQEAGVSTGVSMIAILSAKIADPERDNPAVYGSELARPREWKNQAGDIVISQPIDSRVRCIGGHTWYWGKQLESELQNYYTEYFATLQSGISVLVTVSYEKSVEAEGRPIARTIARNLRVIWKPKNSEPTRPDEPNCNTEN